MVQWLQDNAGMFSSDKDRVRQQECIQKLISDLTDKEEAQLLEAIEGLFLQSRLFEWMKKTILGEWGDDHTSYIFFINGDVRLTRLAEEAIWYSGLVFDSEAASDDETHPAWSAAVDAADWWAETKKEWED